MTDTCLDCLFDTEVSLSSFRGLPVIVPREVCPRSRRDASGDSASLLRAKRRSHSLSGASLASEWGRRESKQWVEELLFGFQRQRHRQLFFSIKIMLDCFIDY
ncbi:hypothetical protein TNCT_613551 [Trichonephila clavata]|uniref:Uncharacterized protein n=1 Tax=Trichonephila clavata TaxID=2740835 RepID=A0A8X6HF69_TRICU|nr:hypothetical protein TNCT_613551 [Trichonephila clavata]